jgi:hypothetical protein
MSDQWEPPRDVPWEECSLRIAEQDVALLPAMLEAHEHRYEELSATAREVYATFFTSDVAFDCLIERCSQLMLERRRFPAHGFRDREWARLAASETALRLRQRAVRARARIMSSRVTR